MRAIARVLRPFVRFLLTQGITYPYLADYLKSVYVDVAIRDFPLQGKRQTDSRISLLTGVHRKDVKRLTEINNREVSPPSNISFGAQVVAKWVSERTYLGKDGRPLPLSRLASDGGVKSFESLVASVSKDIRSRAVLDEWLRLGVVKLDNKDRVCLVAEAFIPERGLDEKVFYLGQNVGDHLSAAVDNVLTDRPHFFERSVYYDALSNASVGELNKMSAELGMQALQKVNKRALELEARDARSPGGAKRRINFGIYFFNASTDDSAGESAEGEQQ